MIDIENEKYGRVVIYEPEDIEEVAVDYPSKGIEDREDWAFEIVHRSIYENASVIAFRDSKKKNCHSS